MTWDLGSAEVAESHRGFEELSIDHNVFGKPIAHG